MKHNVQDLIQFANERPTSLNDDLYQWAADAGEHICALAAEQENLRRANLDCVDLFNQLKEDYDKLLQERKFAYMNGYEGGKQEARDAAQVEIDELKLDAERYRWLRKSHHGDKLGVEVRIGGYSGFYWHGKRAPLSEQKLDTTIDESMKGTI